MFSERSEKTITSDYDTLTVASAPVFIAIGILCLLLLPPVEIARFFPDDIFFYIKTAGNIAMGRGSTFD